MKLNKKKKIVQGKITVTSKSGRLRLKIVKLRNNQDFLIKGTLKLIRPIIIRPINQVSNILRKNN
jgi:hypothetical protein